MTTTAGLLGIMGVSCKHQGSIIQLPPIALDVRFGCNGFEAVMIYAVAVIAFPASWRRKVMGIIAGFGAIQVINILRIGALAYVGIHFNDLFEYIHIYVAQGIMIAISLGVFFVYLTYAGTPGKAPV